jgi:hypothetical protein
MIFLVKDHSHIMEHDIKSHPLKFVNIILEAKTDDFAILSNLCGIDLKHDLAGSDLSNTDLRGIDFSGADLRDVDFTNAILKGTNFHNANLHGAIFNGADLTRADFRSSSISHANFANVIIENTSFDDGVVFLVTEDNIVTSVVQRIRVISSDSRRINRAPNSSEPVSKQAKYRFHKGLNTKNIRKKLSYKHSKRKDIRQSLQPRIARIIDVGKLAKGRYKISYKEISEFEELLDKEKKNKKTQIKNAPYKKIKIIVPKDQGEIKYPPENLDIKPNHEK